MRLQNEIIHTVGKGGSILHRGDNTRTAHLTEYGKFPAQSAGSALPLQRSRFDHHLSRFVDRIATQKDLPLGVPGVKQFAEVISAQGRERPAVGRRNCRWRHEHEIQAHFFCSSYAVVGGHDLRLAVREDDANLTGPNRLIDVLAPDTTERSITSAENNKTSLVSGWGTRKDKTGLQRRRAPNPIAFS